jgi:hypothetical protein
MDMPRVLAVTLGMPLQPARRHVVAVTYFYMQRTW